MVSNSSKTTSYAIDFGTSNTAIARWNAATQKAELVKLPGLSQQLSSLPPLIPSLVYIEDAQAAKIIVGQAVRDRGLDFANNPRFFRSFKRGIGTEIQGFLPELDGKNLSFEQVGEWFLQELITNLQTDTAENLQSLVLTVPVDSFESYRNWLMGVCQSLKVEQIRILDEPTAVLTPQEVDDLFVILRQMTQDGHALIFISHKLQVLLRFFFNRFWPKTSSFATCQDNDINFFFIHL